MIGEILRNSRGEIITPKSEFRPSQAEADITARVSEDYNVGHDNLHRPLREYSDKSVLDEMTDNQKLFNNYIPPRSIDPRESWKAQTFRPLTRNKVISIAAHVTSRVLYPNVFAQNDNDEEDRDAANVMRDLIEWTVRNSDYEHTFLYAVISSLVNPAVILMEEFAEAKMEIKMMGEDGKIKKQEVIDDVNSGWQTHIVPVDELLIANLYEAHIQRQRFLIRRRFVEYDTAKALYGKHENYNFVRPGVKSVFNADDGAFYEIKDDSLNTLVEEVTYYNRHEDVELVFLNGIIVTDTDARMKHRDEQDRPKYPFAKSGYEPIDERRFFYYRSAVSKLKEDQKLVDTMWNMVMDGTFLSIMPVRNVFGGDNSNKSVWVPGATNYFGHETKVEAGQVGDLNAGFNALQKLEQSMEESSQARLLAGQSPEGSNTAREFLSLEQNAKIQLGLFAQMIAKLVQDYGYLRVNNILHHMTVADANKITAGDSRLKFNSIVLPDQVEGGKKVTKKIRFNGDRVGEEMIEKDELERRQFALLEEEGNDLESEERIYDVQPDKFRDLRFQLIVDADVLTSKSETLEKAFKLELYDRGIQNPILDQSALTRDFLLEPFVRGEADKYLKKQAEQALGGVPQQGGGKTSPLVDQTSQTQSLQEIITG